LPLLLTLSTKYRDQSSRILFSVAESTKSANFSTFADVAEEILKRSYDRVLLLYNHFNSVISFTVSPVVLRTQSHIQKLLESGNDKLALYDFEDELQEEHTADLSQFALAGVLYTSYLDSQTSELGARMTSMDNASRNAGEVLKKLELKYNRGRQTSITTELIEVQKRERRERGLDDAKRNEKKKTIEKFFPQRKQKFFSLCRSFLVPKPSRQPPKHIN
jgi:ATP synthase F1 gamma subunit